ncbi:ROK family transcriptional regulator [Blastococcus sp. TF02A-30]|uniref:ROK family transcriptional regulator n=1 Tax=Blastococcus sp. TF02A-30 TaxID=2250580 RepID=UPI001314B25C|nr:ROK family transcriptional regulator [Blastococcus sp. TF02A-30]
MARTEPVGGVGGMLPPTPAALPGAATATSPERRSARDHVIGALWRRGPSSRAELARSTSLAPSTVSALVAELLSNGLAVEVEGAAAPVGPSGGRPATLVSLSRAAGVVLGVDVGQRHARVLLVDAAHTVVAEHEAVLPAGLAPGDVLGCTAVVVREVLSKAGIGVDALAAVGVGLPWLVRRPAPGGRGRPAWLTIPVAGRVAVADALGLPSGVRVHLDNDANLGALGEWVWGAARGRADVVHVLVSTGIGAGLVLGGRLHGGTGGTAGEIGHLVVEPDGPRCACGKRGCLEAVAGGPALLAALPDAPSDATLATVVAAARDGDGAARRALTRAGTGIGRALATVCDLLDPQLAVIGGELADAGSLLLDPLRRALDEEAMSSAAADVEVVAAELGVRAPVMGAVAAVMLDA